MLFAHAHNLAQYVGKGHLLYKRTLAAASAASISRCNVHGVCALQSSSVMMELEFLYNFGVGHASSSGTPYAFIPTSSSRKTSVEG